MSSTTKLAFTWNPADGQAPPMEARAAYANFVRDSRQSDSRTMSGFFIGRQPNEDDAENEESCSCITESYPREKVVVGVAKRLLTVDLIVGEIDLGNNPLAAAAGGAGGEDSKKKGTMFDQSDDSDDEPSPRREDASSSSVSSSSSLSSSSSSPSSSRERAWRDKIMAEGNDKKIDNNKKDNIISKPMMVRTLAINTDVWNDTWGQLYENDDVMDGIGSFLGQNKRRGGGRQQQQQSNRCVLIRCKNRARLEDDDDDNTTRQGRNSLVDFRQDLSAQARSCGPVETIRTMDSKGEMTVQFTTETAARAFLASLTPPAMTPDNYGAVGGILEALRNEAGFGYVTALLVPAQEKVVPSAAAGGRGRGRGSGVNPHNRQALVDSVLGRGRGGLAAAAAAAGGGGADPRPSIQIAAAVWRLSTEERESGALFPDVGIQLGKEYIKALLEPLCGAVDVEDTLLLSDETLAKQRISVSKCSGDEEAALRSMVSKFTVFFRGDVPDDEDGGAGGGDDSPGTGGGYASGRSFDLQSATEARQKALHMLQYPLRQLFGLGMF